ncbi:hypothetical protein Q5O24_13600 [Eubacteriaceae bacterium ES3]|nr:hypothetical protein Q5O24_13600 [Eubacteriaceae bacterium ES3]
MSLDIIIDACDKKIFCENYEYLNEESDIPFDERCQMKTIISLKNEDELFDALSFIALQNEQDFDNNVYTIFEQEDFENLRDSFTLSEEVLVAVEQILDEVDFSKQVVTIYPWW